MNIAIPHRSRWDFKLVVLDSLMVPITTLNYGIEPELSSLHLESAGEDTRFRCTLIAVRYGPDLDLDSYNRHDTLVFRVAPGYDSTYSVTARIYARYSADSELLHLATQPFYISQADSLILKNHGGVVSPGLHGYWDFRLELYDESGQRKGWYSYNELGLTECWTGLKLERWNEDPRMNTIFLPNPIHSLDDSTLWDHADADEAVPFVAYWNVGALPHRTSPGDSLKGSYVVIRDLHTPTVTPPRSTDGLFPFFRHDTGFEAVMCYFWIDWNQTYLQTLGFFSACNRQLPVDPHGDTAHNGWYETPYPYGSGWIRLGDGGTDAGEDADFILHEYCHAIMDNIAPSTFGPPNAPNETNAICEGTSDYWATSAIEMLCPTAFPATYWGEWFNRSLPSSQPFVRRVNSSKHYPQDIVNEPHEDGEIWSACLWQMKDALGKRITDSLCLRSFERMRTAGVVNPSFLVGARYLLKADTLAYAAAHAFTIAQIFLNRGILPCDCPLQGDINADLAIDVFDVIGLIGICFNDDPRPQDLTCRNERADVNCNASIDVFDVIYLIDAAFSGGASPCDPCIASPSVRRGLESIVSRPSATASKESRTAIAGEIR